MITLELSQDFRSAGIDPGDIVLVHSNLRRTIARYVRLGHKISVNDVLEALLSAVGNEGTLLFPLFNFVFTKGVPFNIKTTRSQMGVLTECARLYSGCVRTGHPIYSFGVIGRDAQLFSRVDNISGYGSDSPFGILHRMNGKIAVLDLPDNSSMTFYHYIEEAHAVPYRYHKFFSGLYTGFSGVTEEKKYSIYVRDLDRGVVTDVDPLGELMWQEGLYRGDRPGEGVGLRVVGAQAMYDFVSKQINEGKAEGLLYVIEREKIKG